MSDSSIFTMAAPRFIRFNLGTEPNKIAGLFATGRCAVARHARDAG